MRKQTPDSLQRRVLEMGIKDWSRRSRSKKGGEWRKRIIVKEDSSMSKAMEI